MKHRKVCCKNGGPAEILHVFWGVVYASNKQLSSLLHYFSNGVVFKKKFKTKVELIYEHLSSLYQNNDTVVVSFVFEKEFGGRPRCHSG